MPKLRNRPSASPRAIDDAVTELGSLADQDRGIPRDRIPRSSEEAEEAALPAQRAVYEKIMGKAPKRRAASQRDERGRLDEEEEVDEDEELEAPAKKHNARAKDDDEDEDLDDDRDADDDDDEGGTSRVSKKKLDGALNALRRAKVPKKVWDKLDDEDVVELAGSLAGYQSHADRALQSKDETIRALTAAIAGKGGQAKAGGESVGAETPPDEDLGRAAEGLARALGVENDATTKKALEDYARAMRPNGGRSTKAEADRIESLQATVRDLILDQGVRRVRRNYSEHLSDPEGVRALKKRAIALSADDGYEGDVPRLFKDAARSLWGEPTRTERDGRARARRGSATPTQSRRTERSDSATPSEGTEEHDRAVYSAIVGKSRRSLATRR